MFHGGRRGRLELLQSLFASRTPVLAPATADHWKRLPTLGFRRLFIDGLDALGRLFAANQTDRSAVAGAYALRSDAAIAGKDCRRGGLLNCGDTTIKSDCRQNDDAGNAQGRSTRNCIKEQRGSTKAHH